MDPRFKVIQDPTGSVENGVLFWLGWFTLEQVKALRGDGHAVRAIITNIKAKLDGTIKVKRNSLRQLKRNKNMTKRFNSDVLDTDIPELKVEHTFGMPNSSIG